MSDYLIMKAVEFDKLPVKYKKLNPGGVQQLVDEGFWTQKKYDGCMGIAFMRRSPGNTVMVSRTGKDYTTSCQGILDEIREAADETGSWDDFAVIGEVWRPIEEAAFPAISGEFRRRQRSDKLRFIANDLLPLGLNTSRAYRLRFQDLCAMFPPMDLAACRVHVAETWHTPVDVKARALAWQGMGGFDGAIARDPDAGYTVGEVKAGEIVKVKPTLSLDLMIVRTDVAPGAKTGRPVYTVVVQYNGVTSFVGSGVPHVLSWEAGDIVEIECLGITADGKLREPRWKGLRFDKLKAD